MKVSNALVCLDCDELFDSKVVVERCPVCGSPYIAFLCRFFPSLYSTNGGQQYGRRPLAACS